MAKRRKSSGGLLRFVKIIFFLALITIIGFVVFYFVYPDVSKLKKENPRKTSFMEYREAQWQSKGRKLNIQKRWVALPNISPYLVKAILIAEDDKFWSHHGFDLDAIQKALEKDLEKGKFKAGGSTISQQLVKNLYLTPEKSIARKFKEAIITWRVERTLSKRRILELYLNVVEWGEGIFGAEMASQHHFGKPAALLTAEEAAKLAVVLPNPIRFKVDGTSKYTERRAKIIYDIMVKRGIVIPDYEEVIKTPQIEINGGHDLQTGTSGTNNTLDKRQDIAQPPDYR
ncbi:MAG: monofunctional biosynthetic peptidoglycan transglycosylase [Syntrophus sp. (in: bacteria)]|nr:monofunctional biosynthetic peptidoglycan transglycosylase [Syntrophus sp. (in: bacteria)]